MQLVLLNGGGGITEIDWIEGSSHMRPRFFKKRIDALFIFVVLMLEFRLSISFDFLICNGIPMAFDFPIEEAWVYVLISGVSIDSRSSCACK